MAKGTLYGYFADKESLIEAVVTSGFDELAGVVQRATHGAATRALGSSGSHASISSSSTRIPT